MICCQRSFNSERRAGELFLFRERKRRRKRRRKSEGGGEGWQEDENGRGERVIRLLGFNQYGIWPEDDWKTNLISEAIRLSFISLAVSLVDLSGASFVTMFCFVLVFSFTTHHSKCRILARTDALNKANRQTCKPLSHLKSFHLM